MVRAVSALCPALLVAMALLAPATADAERVRAPLSAFNVELPTGWRIGAIKRFGGGTGAQYLNHEGQDHRVTSVVLAHVPMASCVAATLPESGEHRFGADWLPAGWTGKIDREGEVATVCWERGGFPIVLMASFGAASRPEHVALLRAFETAWRTPPGLDRLETIELPKSRVRVTLPPRVELYDTDTYTDRLRATGPRGTADYEIGRVEGACDLTALEKADAVTGASGGSTSDPERKLAPSSDTAPAGWRRFELGTKGRARFCVPVGGRALVVTSPGDAVLRATGAPDPTGPLLEALSQWLAPPTSSSEITLRVSNLQLRPPSGWAVAGAQEVDLLTRARGGLISEVTVARRVGACDPLATGGARHAFAPAWLPAGWRAHFDVATSSFEACTGVDGDARLVVIPIDKMPASEELVAVLEAVRSARVASATPPEPTTTSTTTPTTTSTPTPTPTSTSPSGGFVVRRARRGPVLPFPFRLSYQTVGGPDQRGHGARLGLARRFGMEELLFVEVRGELAYDTLSKLGHDVQSRLGLDLTGGIKLLVAAGHDAWGSNEDMPVLAGGYYGGLGASFSTAIGERPVQLEGLHLWRSEVDETRFALSIGLELGPLRGLIGDVRLTGDVTTILVGSNVRL